jgi:hypothetical protein
MSSAAMIKLQWKHTLQTSQLTKIKKKDNFSSKDTLNHLPLKKNFNLLA